MSGRGERRPGWTRRRVMGGLIVAELVQLAAFAQLEQIMKRTGGAGIIALELAGSRERARKLMDRWGTEGRAAARKSLLLDFVFPPTYASFQALACLASSDALAHRGQNGLAAAGPVLAWSQAAAAGFDYLENVSLLLVLGGRERRFAPLARRAALVKFALLALGLGYVGLAAVPRGS
jgi:hypothetical protein